MTNKLVVCYIGQDCQEFLPLSLDSIKEYADAMVFVDGGSKDNTLDILDKHGFYPYDYIDHADRYFKENETRHLIPRDYDQKDKGGNGRARNCYLEFIKKHYNGWYCLVLDPDEVVDDNFKKFKENYDWDKMNTDILSLHMRHLINTFGFEDATLQTHFAPHRFFKISDDLFYPETEHPVLSSNQQKKYGASTIFTIWHLRHVRDMFRIKNKYDTDRQRSTSHTPEMLRAYYINHLFGRYPVNPINPIDLPKVIKDHFEIIDDEIYFMNRGLEHKHWIDSNHWIEYFKLREPLKSVLLCGDGLGVRTFTMRAMGIPAYGFDISKYTVENNVGRYKNEIYWKHNITDPISTNGFEYHLIVCYDLLEHLTEEELDKALKIFIRQEKYFYLVFPLLETLI